MEILFNKKTDTHSSCQVTLEPKDYQALVDKNMKNYANRSTIKGFRQGSPGLLSIVKKRYGREILQDVIFTEAQKQFNQALAKEDIFLLSNPSINEEKLRTINWLQDKTFSVTYQFDIAPSFELALDKTIQVNSFSLEGPTTNEEIEAYIISMQEELGTFKKLDTPKEKSFVYGNVLFSEEKRSPIDDFRLKLTAEHAKMLQGLKLTKKRDEVVLTSSVLAKLTSFFPKKLSEKIETSKETPTFRILDIFASIPAPLETSFFDKICDEKGIKTLAACKEALGKQLYEQNKRKINYILEKDIKKELIAVANISLPASYEAYAVQMQWDLILHYLAKKYTVKVEEKDIINELGNVFIYQAAMNGQKVNQESIIKAIKQELQSPEKRNYTNAKMRLLEKKLIALAKDTITIQTQPTNYIELESILSSRLS